MHNTFLLVVTVEPNIEWIERFKLVDRLSKTDFFICDREGDMSPSTVLNDVAYCVAGNSEYFGVVIYKARCRHETQ